MDLMWHATLNQKRRYPVKLTREMLNEPDIDERMALEADRLDQRMLDEYYAGLEKDARESLARRREADSIEQGE